MARFTGGLDGVTPKTYQGSLAFATTNTSRVYVNPEVCHVSSIWERFSALSTTVEAVEGPSNPKLPPERYDHKPYEPPERNDHKLYDCGSSGQGNMHWRTEGFESMTRCKMTPDLQLGVVQCLYEGLLDVSAKQLISKMPPGDNFVPGKLQILLGKN
ncbi:hypothetical protein POM88_010424 [Heracleum sosnowskyi]|uniref:Uncharacterized protein n=1 Tax=Heracleum sosnowskyi TaxID=360622 RepID=A0AAD8N1H2_9APIA|nr:hypothetical protein POM88_010424 [Heracleum sosnowskyi]